MRRLVDAAQASKTGRNSFRPVGERVALFYTDLNRVTELSF
jgi:hypothetical protein